MKQIILYLTSYHLLLELEGVVTFLPLLGKLLVILFTELLTNCSLLEPSFPLSLAALGLHLAANLSLASFLLPLLADELLPDSFFLLKTFYLGDSGHPLVL